MKTAVFTVFFMMVSTQAHSQNVRECSALSAIGRQNFDDITRCVEALARRVGASTNASMADAQAIRNLMLMIDSNRKASSRAAQRQSYQLCVLTNEIEELRRAAQLPAKRARATPCFDPDKHGFDD
jgi:hypothetical protein